MPGALPDRLQCTANIAASLDTALAFDEQCQLHKCRFQGELVLVEAFEQVGKGIGGWHCVVSN